MLYRWWEGLAYTINIMLCYLFLQFFIQNKISEFYKKMMLNNEKLETLQPIISSVGCLCEINILYKN
jgi:hypothetical protein